MSNTGMSAPNWVSHPDYQGLELSTQLLIQGALARGLNVEVLDEAANYIRLSKGSLSQPVVQATRTNLDPYLGVHLMTHKPLTNLTLHRAGLPVPQGTDTSSWEEARAWVKASRLAQVVIKPASTNFGQGISILKKGFSLIALEAAWDLALKYDRRVMVEEFVPGDEVRVLIIGGKVRAALQRNRPM
jgi:D-alanine-D-alanine ligase-like ATP-grasp enzyme